MSTGSEPVALLADSGPGAAGSCDSAGSRVVTVLVEGLRVIDCDLRR